MTFEKNKIKKSESLAVIVEGIQLNEILDASFLDFLTERYGEKFNVHATELSFCFTEKKEPEFKEGANIMMAPAPYIKLEHPGPKDFENKKIVLRSSNFDLIDRFVKE